MSIIWKPVVLTEPRELLFGDHEPIIVERVDGRPLDLRVKFSHGLHLLLQGAVDTDERHPEPRITVFRGGDPAQLFVFGGPQAYRPRSDGRIVDRLATFRDLDEYEVGILVIDDRLTPRWLHRKYIDDGDPHIADGLLCLRRPFRRPVKRRLSDGQLVSRHRDYMPGVDRLGVPDDRDSVTAFLHALDGRGLAHALPAVDAALARRPASTSRGEIDALRRLIANEIDALGHCDPDDPGDGAALDRVIEGWLATGGDLGQLRDLISGAVFSS